MAELLVDDFVVVEAAPSGEARRRIVLAVGHAECGAVRQRPRIQAVSEEFPDRMGSDVADVCDKRVAQVLLDKEVPAFDVTAAVVCRSAGRASADWQRGKAGGKGWRHLKRNADRQGQGVAGDGIDGDSVGCASGI